jgi:O-antigen ligase/tetratricopeptide (TPR) repeat protein
MPDRIYHLFLFTLIFAPLAFGARAEWSFVIVATCTFSGFLLFFKYCREQHDIWYQTPGLLPLMLFLCWIVIQIIPLPIFLVEIISPVTVKLHHETIGIVEPVEWLSLSMNKRSTLLEFFRYATYAVFYILTVQLLVRKEYLKKTIHYIVILSSGMAILAILQYFLSADEIYWFRSVPENATPFGPYMYHNHYAGFMEMVFPLSLVLFIHTRPIVLYGSFRQRIFEFLNNPTTNIHLLLGLSTIIIGASIFLSYSRGGIISLCIALCFLAGMLALQNRKKENYFLFPTIMIMILFTVGWFGWDFIFERFEKIRNADGLIYDARLLLWADTMNMIKDFPLTGTGFGTFIDMYPGYRSVPENLIFEHAHNDYLEFFTNGGLIGSGLILWFMVSIFNKTIRAFRKRRDSYSMIISIACMTGIISILLHSVTDFNLQNGANGLYFFFLFGLLVSATHTRLHVRNEQTYLIKPKKPPGKWIPAVTAVLLIVSLVVQSGCVTGKYYFSTIQNIYLDETVSEGKLRQLLPIAQKASLYDPLNALYYFGIGNISYFLRDGDAAVDHYQKAVFCNPAKGEYLQRLGIVLSENGRTGDAEKLFQTGIIRDKNSPESYSQYALWLLSQNRADESVVFFQKAMELDLNKANLLAVIDRMEKGGAGNDLILKALPQQVESFLHFADYLKKKNGNSYLPQVYQTALRLLVKQKDGQQAWHFIALSNYVMAKGQSDEALRIMGMARDRMPENPWIRVKSGDLYHQVGISYRAVEEYQKALSIDPNLAPARKKLSALERG